MPHAHVGLASFPLEAAVTRIYRAGQNIGATEGVRHGGGDASADDAGYPLDVGLVERRLDGVDPVIPGHSLPACVDGGAEEGEPGAPCRCHLFRPAVELVGGRPVYAPRRISARLVLELEAEGAVGARRGKLPEALGREGQVGARPRLKCARGSAPRPMAGLGGRARHPAVEEPPELRVHEDDHLGGPHLAEEVEAEVGGHPKASDGAPPQPAEPGGAGPRSSRVRPVVVVEGAGVEEVRPSCLVVAGPPKQRGRVKPSVTCRPMSP